MAEEKIIAINFRRILKKPASKRRRVIVDFFREQVARHAKVQVRDVLIKGEVAKALIKVPRRIKVKVSISEGRAIVGLI